MRIFCPDATVCQIDLEPVGIDSRDSNDPLDNFLLVSLASRSRIAQMFCKKVSGNACGNLKCVKVLKNVMQPNFAIGFENIALILKMFQQDFGGTIKAYHKL